MNLELEFLSESDEEPQVVIPSVRPLPGRILPKGCTFTPEMGVMYVPIYVPIEKARDLGWVSPF